MAKKIMIPVVLLLLTVLNRQTAFSAEKSGVPELRQTFAKYTKAVQERDMTNLFETVALEGVDFIDTMGKHTQSLEEYRDYHREWFASTTWTIDFKLMKMKEYGNFGYFLVIYTYKDLLPDQTKHETRGYATLLFQRQKNGWKLILDVCTPIRNAG